MSTGTAPFSLITVFDGGIYYVDEQFGRLLDAVNALESLDLPRDTVIAVVSDHGEAFLEHRFLGHVEVYDAALRVPLILHDPGRPRGLRIRGPVQLADLFATLLDRCGLKAPPGSGDRLLPGGEPSSGLTRLDFSYFRPDDDSPYRAYGVRHGDWKLVWHNRKVDSAYETQLFHTGDDPGELRPLRGQSERRGRMLAQLQQ